MVYSGYATIIQIGKRLLMSDTEITTYTTDLELAGTEASRMIDEKIRPYKNVGEFMLYQHYNTGDDSGDGAYGNRWTGQTFTIGSIPHDITSVKLKLWRGNGNVGIVIVGIRATDVNGKPTGNDLTNGSIDGNRLLYNPAGVWYEFKLTRFTLNENTKYAIVLRAPNATNYWVYWKLDQTAPTYEGGSVTDSTDGGLSWSLDVTEDMMFEVWGIPQFTETKEPFVFTILPLTAAIIPDILTEICADIGAGLFKRRHKPELFDQGWLNQGLTKLDTFIKGNWYQGKFYFSTSEAEA